QVQRDVVGAEHVVPGGVPDGARVTVDRVGRGVLGLDDLLAGDVGDGQLVLREEVLRGAHRDGGRVALDRADLRAGVVPAQHGPGRLRGEGAGLEVALGQHAEAGGAGVGRTRLQVLPAAVRRRRRV